MYLSNIKKENGNTSFIYIYLCILCNSVCPRKYYICYFREKYNYASAGQVYMYQAILYIIHNSLPWFSVYSEIMKLNILIQIIYLHIFTFNKSKFIFFLSKIKNQYFSTWYEKSVIIYTKCFIFEIQ